MDMINIEKKDEDAEENPLIPGSVTTGMLPLLGGALIGGIGMSYAAAQLEENGTINADNKDVASVLEIALGIGIGYAGYKYGKTPVVKNLITGAGVGVALTGANELVEAYVIKA